MSSDLTAVVAGHICLDIIPQISGLTPEQFRAGFVPGRLLSVGPVLFATGGPVSNTGLALHKLGVATRLMGKVGDDLIGGVVRQIVGAHSAELAAGMVVDPDVHSSYTVVVSPPGLDRFFLHYPGANDTFRANDVRYDLLSDVRLFHFGYPPIMRRMYEDGGQELAALYRRAKETGVTTSLDTCSVDPAGPAGGADWRLILQRTLASVDVFLPSIEEILFMLRRRTYDALVEEAGSYDILPLITPALLSDVGEELLGWGAKVVGLKLGHRGFYLRTAAAAALRDLGRARPQDIDAWAGRELWSACFKVDVVGTAGSGDATIAGFLSALLRDFSPAGAVTAAVAVGACNVEAADTLSGVRTWEETMARVSSGWPRHGLLLEAPGWRFDEADGLWVGPAGRA